MQKIFEVIMKKETSSKYQSFGKFRAVIISDFEYLYEVAIPKYKQHLFECGKINIIDLFKNNIKKTLFSLEKELKSNDLEDETVSFFESKINSKMILLEYESEKEIFKYYKKEFSWFLDVFLVKNPEWEKEILSNLIHLCLMEIDFWDYFEKMNRENIIKNHLYDEIILKYKEVGIDILVEDHEFYKNKLNSVNEYTNIICNQANRYLQDKRLDIYFCLPVPRFLLEALDNYCNTGLIEKLAFRIDRMTKSFFVFDSFDYGAKLKNDILNLPELSRFFDLDNYQDALWIKHNRIKKHLTFEETCDDFELFDDSVVTQLIHLEYFIENEEYYIKHLDHEYIIYSLDNYQERLENSEIKGHKKVKTFKIDDSRIPFFSKYKNEYFLFIVLNSFFKNKGLLKEYFENIT